MACEDTEDRPVVWIGFIKDFEEHARKNKTSIEDAIAGHIRALNS